PPSTVAISYFSSPPLAPLPFFQCLLPHRALHSFPTRRSSDLDHHNIHFDVDEDVLHLGVAATLQYTFDFLKASEPLSFTRKYDQDRKSTRLNSSHVSISYAVFCLKKKK